MERMTMDFDFEEMLFEGLLKEEDSKKEFMQFIHYMTWGVRHGIEMDNETWNQLCDIELILCGTKSRWSESDGCWYIKVLCTNEEIAHDSGDVIERIVQSWNPYEYGEFESKLVRKIATRKV